MKEYLKDIFPKIIRFSKELDDLAILTNKSWVLLNEEVGVHEVWIFRSNNDLIVSKNGIAIKGKWEFIQEANSLYIEVGEYQRLINKAFIDDVALLLRLDGDKDIIALANENKINEAFKINEYIENQYLEESHTGYLKNVDEKTVIKPKEISLDDKIRAAKNELKEYKYASLIIPLPVIAGILLIIFREEKYQFGVFLILIGFVAALIVFGIYQEKSTELKKLQNKKIRNDLELNKSGND
jgi:hypothetical protein